MTQQRKLGWIATRMIKGQEHFVGACLAAKGRQRGIERWLKEMERPGVTVSPYYSEQALRWAGGLPQAPQMRPGPNWDEIDRMGRR